jgi:hypothetical protein
VDAVEANRPPAWLSVRRWLNCFRDLGHPHSESSIAARQSFGGALLPRLPRQEGEILPPRQLWRSSCFAFCHFCLAFSPFFSSVLPSAERTPQALSAVICRSTATSRLPLHRVEMPHRRSTGTYCEAGPRYTWNWPLLLYHEEILRRLVSGRY